MSLSTPEAQKQPDGGGATLECKSEIEPSCGVEVINSPVFRYVEKNTFIVQKQCSLTASDGDNAAATITKPGPNRRLSRSRPQCSFETESYSIDFRNLLADRDAKLVIDGTDNLDLLHGASALYSLSLPDVEHDTIYKCIHAKDAHTILVLLSIEDAKDHCLASMKNKVRRKRKEESEKEYKSVQEEMEGSDENSFYEEDDSFEDADSGDSDDESEYNDKFDGVFSDFDLSSADDDTDEDDSGDEIAESYMNTMDGFINKVWKRREKLDEFFEQREHKNLKSEDIPDELIGVERRLIGVVTYEHYSQMLPEKIVVITLLSTRRKYMGLGVGGYMLKHIRNSEIVGANDVIIVNADEGAVKFFEKQGFTADVLLNSPYDKIHDCWFNTKRMIRFSNFGGDHPTLKEMEMVTSDAAHPLTNFELNKMELEFRLWNEKSVQAHQKLSLNMVRMKNEIYNLNNRVRSKETEIEKLRSELEVKDGMIEKERLKCELDKMRTFGKPDDGGGYHEKNQQLVVVDTNNNYEQPRARYNGHLLAAEGQKRIQETLMTANNNKMYSTSPNKNVQLKKSIPAQSFQSLLVHIKEIKEKVNQEKDKIHEREKILLQILNASNPNKKKELSLVQKLNVCPQLTARFNAAQSKVDLCQEDRGHVEDMIYCGKKLEDQLNKISNSGFDTSEFTSSKFGCGLHFTKHAHQAAMLTDDDDQLVVCKVLLGRCRQLDSSDVTNHYDSVLVRDVDCSGNSSDISSRYVVFDPSHVLPYSIVQYKNNNNH